MASIGSLQLSHELGICKHYMGSGQFKTHALGKGRAHFLGSFLSSHALWQDAWSCNLFHWPCRSMHVLPSTYNVVTCQSFFTSGQAKDTPIFKAVALALTRSYNDLNGSSLVLQLAPAVGIIAFALWGLGPLMRYTRHLFLRGNDNNWKKSRTNYVLTYYLQPLLLWSGATLVCRVLDPVILPSEASQAIKQRLLNFVRSLSTVLAFAYCLSSLIQQAQKFFMEMNDSDDTRNMGFQFAGKAVYTAVWVAAVSLFMELLGFSTQKWITAGGLGTVLLTLAGREIFTNFLSSVMIHATRPFVVNEWIQTKIEGYEVSGTVEHVGWWSPTIIRGDDREAVHIPNHKFTVNVVRNISQKTHWRIKTHLAISHSDVNKINNIVADMRKVLAKNPQVEQQRLHRRVFLDNINPESQALLILVSCFVKTSHFEEYLCVKEAILLDLLRVISHHRARLATPIRTVQKFYGDTNMENIPYSETCSRAINRPFLLIEPPYKINGDDKAKSHPAHVNEGQESKAGPATPKSPNVGPEQAKKSNSGDAHQMSEKAEGSSVTNSTSPPPPKPQPDALAKNPASSSPPKGQLEGLESMGLNSKDITLLGAAFEKSSITSPESDKSKLEAGVPPAVSTHIKQEGERLAPPPPPQPSSMPALEENIVLGVALDGGKRTLPIEEGMEEAAKPVDVKELAACCNSSGPSVANDKKESQIPALPQGD